MEFIPLDKYERSVLRLLIKRNRLLCEKTVKTTELSLKQNVALINLSDCQLVCKSKISKDEYALTEKGKRNGLHDKGERFWKSTTFLIPTIISILSIVFSIIKLT